MQYNSFLKTPEKHVIASPPLYIIKEPLIQNFVALNYFLRTPMIIINYTFEGSTLYIQWLCSGLGLEDIPAF